MGMFILKKDRENKDHYYLHIHSTTLQHIYTLKYSGDHIYSWPRIAIRCTVLKPKVHDKIWFICTHTELRPKCKGLHLDCNSRTQFILQCTRQLSSVCRVYVCDVSVHVWSRKESPNTGWMSGRKSLHTIISCKQNVDLG